MISSGKKANGWAAFVFVVLMPIIGIDSLARAQESSSKPAVKVGEKKQDDRDVKAAQKGRLAALLGSLPQPTQEECMAIKRDDPEWRSYLAHVGAGEASLRLNEVAATKRWLAGAPEKHRGWEWSYLNSQADQSLGVVANVGATVFEIAVSPDGLKLALACDDGVLRVVESTTANELLNIKAHEGQMFRAAFSPDGSLIGTTGRDSTAKLWDAKTGEERLVFRGHDKPVTGIVFNAAGDRVATSSYTSLAEAPYVLGTIKIWDAKTGEVVSTLTGGEKPISMIRFSPDGSRVAASTWHGLVDIWEIDKPERAMSLKVPDEGMYTALNCAEFSPDGGRIVAGSKDHTARVWDAKSGELLGTMRHDGWVTATTFSADGSRIVTGAHDNLIRIWDATSLSRTSPSPQPSPQGGEGESLARGSSEVTSTSLKELSVLRGHMAGPWSVVFSRDGTRLYSAGVGGEVRQWDAAFSDYGDVRLMKSSGCYAVQYSEDDRVLYSCNHDGSITTWDGVTNKVLKTWTAHDGNTANTISAADNGRVLSCSWDKTAKVWDGATGELLKTLSHEFGIYHAAISADGKVAATVPRGAKAIFLWDAESGEKTKELKGFEKGIAAVEFSRDGARLVSAGSDGTVRVWNVQTGSEESAMRGHKGGVMHAAFSDDGKYVASGGEDGTVRLWTVDGRSLWSRSVANSEVNRVAFSTDGTRVAAGSQVCTLLDVSTGDDVATFRPHKETIWDLSFSRDGRRLATASTNGEIVVMDVRSVRERVEKSTK